jgi:hypothetical protein
VEGKRTPIEEHFIVDSVVLDAGHVIGGSSDPDFYAGIVPQNLVGVVGYSDVCVSGGLCWKKTGESHLWAFEIANDQLGNLNAAVLTDQDFRFGNHLERPRTRNEKKKKDEGHGKAGNPRDSGRQKVA